MELTQGLGADRGCECVGWQAHDPQGHEHPNMTLNNLVKSVRATGGLGIVGVFTQDPKSPDTLLKEGEWRSTSPTYFEKGLTVGTGQCDVKRYNRLLRDLIHDDRAAPSFIVSHELASTRRPTRTSTSTRGTRDGPRWSCIRVEQSSRGRPAASPRGSRVAGAAPGPCQRRQTRAIF